MRLTLIRRRYHDIIADDCHGYGRAHRSPLPRRLQNVHGASGRTKRSPPLNKNRKRAARVIGPGPECIRGQGEFVLATVSSRMDALMITAPGQVPVNSHRES